MPDKEKESGKNKDPAEEILSGPVENFSRNIVDSNNEENARSADNKGLEAKIVRTTDGNCCPWCTEMAGEYEYSKTMDTDVFRRHDNCGCDVEYICEKTRQDVWSKKRNAQDESERSSRINNDKESNAQLNLDNKKAKVQRQRTELEEQIKSDIRDVLGLPKADVHLTPKQIDIENYAFDDYHINKTIQHNVTHEQAVKYVKESKISVTVWGGTRERYYSENGATYVNLKTKTISTAYSKREFYGDVKRILEIINKYEL